MKTDIYVEADFLPSHSTDRSNPPIRFRNCGQSIRRNQNSQSQNCSKVKKWGALFRVRLQIRSVGNLNAFETIAPTSTVPSLLETVPNVFSLESVRPLSSALPRKNKDQKDVKSNRLSSSILIQIGIDAKEGNRKTNSVKRRIFSKGKKKWYKNETVQLVRIRTEGGWWLIWKRYNI